MILTGLRRAWRLQKRRKRLWRHFRSAKGIPFQRLCVAAARTELESNWCADVISNYKTADRSIVAMTFAAYIAWLMYHAFTQVLPSDETGRRSQVGNERFFHPAVVPGARFFSNLSASKRARAENLIATRICRNLHCRLTGVRERLRLYTNAPNRCRTH